MRRHQLALLALTFALPVAAQNSVVYDLTTIEGTIEALYHVISGPEGFEIDEATFHSIFTDDARLSATYITREGSQGYISWSPAEYLESVWNGPRERGFFEVEAARTVEEFDNIVHVFSTYESRWNEDDEEPFQRGINSIQMVKRDGRYYIVSILWQGESADAPIPTEYLPGG
ncbi:MAG: hypothetical protein R3284_01705 [Rubricoccaceae bacterium]|nr:hypothetical protein [Rubricoccaceae bacterium]